MENASLRERQEPLKERYEENPETARITLRARGEQQDDVRSCSVDIGRALYDAELHEGAGGPGAGACSGDLLLGSLAACAQLTAQAVSNAFGIEVEIRVEVEGDLDLRGTMGVDEEVPVGFQDIRMTLRVDSEEALTEETRSALKRLTERYCVVYQTLQNPPPVDTSWRFDGDDASAPNG